MSVSESIARSLEIWRDDGVHWTDPACEQAATVLADEAARLHDKTRISEAGLMADGWVLGDYGHWGKNDGGYDMYFFGGRWQFLSMTIESHPRTMGQLRCLLLAETRE